MRLVVRRLRIPEMCTEAARPETVMPEAEPATAIASAPSVPLTMTVSAWPSPVPLPERARQVEVDLR